MAMKLKCSRCGAKVYAHQGQHVERRVSRREKAKVFFCNKCMPPRGPRKGSK